jgi:hypothetical protein
LSYTTQRGIKEILRKTLETTPKKGTKSDQRKNTAAAVFFSNCQAAERRLSGGRPCFAQKVLQTAEQWWFDGVSTVSEP